MGWKNLILVLVLLQLFSFSQSINLQETIRTVQRLRRNKELDKLSVSRKKVHNAHLLSSVTESAASVEELRRRLKKIAENTTLYSAKVLLGVSQMDVHKNNLSRETQNILAKENELAEQKRKINSQISTAQANVASLKQQLQQLQSLERAEISNVKSAQNDLNHKRREKPKRYCIWRCRKKWKKAQRRRIEAAEAVLRAAEQRRAAASANQQAKEKELQGNTKQLTNLQIQLSTNEVQAAEWRKKLLSSTSLSQMVLQLLKDMSSLLLNVQHLAAELTARTDFDDEDLGFGWDEIEGILTRISTYLNNGGFVKDLAGWGVDISGFNIAALQKLGIDIDRSTAALFGIN